MNISVNNNHMIAYVTLAGINSTQIKEMMLMSVS